MSQCVVREADGGKSKTNKCRRKGETYFQVASSHNCSLQVNVSRMRGLRGKTQCSFNAPQAGVRASVRAWRLKGTCQRMTLTGCDDTQFVSLRLNCHLMRAQSGAVSKWKAGISGRDAGKSGLTTSKSEAMTPAASRF